MNTKERFIADFPIHIGSKKEPYIILFDAYTGQGKSYVSKIISNIDKSVILNNDEIRNWLNDYTDKNNLRNELQRYRLELLLKDKKAYYDSLGYKYYIIRLDCSDAVVEKRLQERVKNDDNYSEANYNDYLWMKNNVSHVDDDLIDFVINTEKDVELQVKEFYNKYLEENKGDNHE